MNFIFELLKYFKERKKFWLIPIILILFLLSLILVLASGSPLAPFIYTLF